MDKTSLLKSLRGNIIEELGLEYASDEDKEKLLDETAEYIVMRAMIRVNDMISEADQIAFAEKIDSFSGGELFAWLKDRKIVFLDILAEETAAVKVAMKARAAEVK